MSDVFKIKSSFLHFLFDCFEIIFSQCFDTDKYRSCVLVGFFHIFKTSDIIIGSKAIKKSFERSRALRKLYQIIVFFPFIFERTFFDFRQTFKVEVSTTYDDNHGFSLDAWCQWFECIWLDGSSWFKYDSILSKKLKYGRTNPIFRTADDFYIVVLTYLKRKISNLSDRCSIYKGINYLQIVKKKPFHKLGLLSNSVSKNMVQHIRKVSWPVWKKQSWNTKTTIDIWVLFENSEIKSLLSV